MAVAQTGLSVLSCYLAEVLFLSRSSSYGTVVVVLFCRSLHAAPTVWQHLRSSWPALQRYRLVRRRPRHAEVADSRTYLTRSSTGATKQHYLHGLSLDAVRPCLL